MNPIPITWAKCTIGEISPVIGGGTPPSKDPRSFTEKGGTPWITPADLSGYRETYISRGARNLTEYGFANSSAKLLPKNALLFSSRAPIGYVAIASNPVCTNQGFKSFVLPAGFDPRFGYYFLRHLKPIAEERATGTTFKELSGSAASMLPFLVAPLQEQKRIADKLEAVLGRVDACRARLAHVPDLLKRFRQSVLAAATSGSLTKEWRRSRSLRINQWDSKPLGSVCEAGRIITYGVIKLGQETPDGVPCLRTSNVRWLRIDIEGMKRIEPSLSKDYSRTILRGGEVLVNVRGTLGGVAVVEQTMAGWNVSREVAVLPVDQKMLIPAFLAYLIGAEKTQSWLTGVQKGVAYTGINIEDLRMLPVHIPSIAEQKEIVRRVEGLFASADRIESRLSEAQTAIDRLTPSTLAKAFRGELVSQDPNDEPAIVVLNRLHAKKKDGAIQPLPERTARILPMKAHSQDSIKNLILSFPKDEFSFAELRALTSSSYDDLQEIVFQLLAEKKPILKQVFNAKAETMQFQRIRA